MVDKKDETKKGPDELMLGDTGFKKPGPTEKAEDTKEDTKVENNNSVVPDEPAETPQVRLPSCFVMMTQTGKDKNGKQKEGGVGFKFGEKWQWLTYSELRSVIALANENKPLFNAQLALEREKVRLIEDL